MISLLKNLKCISRLHIHYYPNRWYKSYITSSKAVIVGKSLISAGLDIDRIRHFDFYDKILQIYRQHWVRKFSRHILSKYRQISKKWGSCYTPPHPTTPLIVSPSASLVIVGATVSFSRCLKYGWIQKTNKFCFQYLVGYINTLFPFCKRLLSSLV